MSIEERANKYCLQERGGCIRELIRSHYVVIATEQREIDIEKACEWLENEFCDNEKICRVDAKNHSSVHTLVKGFRNAMKKQ